MEGEAQKPASPSIVLSAQSSMRTEVELDIASILGLEAIIRLLPAWIASRKGRSFFVWRALEAAARPRDD